MSDRIVVGVTYSFMPSDPEGYRVSRSPRLVIASVSLRSISMYATYLDVDPRACTGSHLSAQLLAEKEATYTLPNHGLLKVYISISSTKYRYP